MKRLLIPVLLFSCAPAFCSEPRVSSDNWDLFRDVYSLVIDSYVEPKSPDQLVAGALEGLAAATGPECGYIPKAKLPETEAAEKSGAYLPLYITKDGGFANVICPFRGEDREIEPGDMLRFINGKSVFDMNFPQLIASMRGKDGETVTCGFIKKESFKPYEKKLTVKRPLPPAVRDFREKGAVIEIPCLEAEFDQQFKEKVAMTSGGIILDLRGCASPGEERALAVAGILFGGGSLKVAARNGTVEMPFSGEGLLKDRKLLVIMDKTTARGGEVLALASGKNAVTAGAETFGFAALHEKVMLKNGDALVILTGYFLDRNGKEMKGNPLKPDLPFDVSDTSGKDDFYLKILEKNFAKGENDARSK